jgi:phospholipid/cholesterol/gamma-HCH transport system permease protein
MTMLLAYAQLSLRAFSAIFAPLFGQRGWRLSALFDQMVSIGVASMPTVALANFLLGIVLAIQGAGQFAKLGATDLVANLVAFSILREIGPLITAVIVIGRSGSAITAELGTMKVAEEIEALNVMGIEQKDLFTGLLKALIFGCVVGTVGCFYGIQVEGGAEGVGKATTKSVVTSLTCMLAMDALLTAIIYFIL